MSCEAMHVGAQDSISLDRRARYAVIVIVLGFALKALAIVALLATSKFDGVDDDACVDFCPGYDFGVFLLWALAELILAIPTMFSLGVLWERAENGHRGLLRFLVPGFILNVPVWFLLILILGFVLTHLETLIG
jgi:hypothetical protein